MTRKSALLAALVLLAVASVGAAAGKPSGTIGEFLKDYHEEFRTYGLIFGAAVGLIFAFWRAKIATKQAEAAAARADAAIDQARAANEQASAANEQARIAEQGHITERFSRAIEQLGHDRVAVRIGGLYALKRIAEDSVERDHLAVMDVITNFVRQPPYTNEQRAAAERDKVLRAFRTNPAKENAETDQIDRAEQIAGAAAPPPEPDLIDCPDIVAAIEIIQGRSDDQKAVEDKRKYRLSLTRASLSYLRLPEVDLHIFALAGANLRGTILTGANLTDANLEGANLTGADLGGAKLTDAHLMIANLTAATLKFVNLTSATLWFAKLTGANLTFAKLTDADLRGAKLTGADLADTILTDADLANAILTDADLTDADLTGVELQEAILTRTNLTGANFEGARNIPDLSAACADPKQPPTGLAQNILDKLKPCPIAGQ